MAHRNPYIPNSKSHPFQQSNRPNPILQRHFFESSILAPTHTMRLSNPHTYTSIAFHDRYHQRISTTAGSGQSSYYPHSPHIPYWYDQHANLNSANMAPFREENSSTSYKRKRTDAYPVHFSEHRYSTGNSPAIPNPILDCHFPNTNIVFTGDQYRRNVRSRHGDVSFNPSWLPSSSSAPHQIYTSVNNSLIRTPFQFIHPTAFTGHSSFAMNATNTHNHGINYSEQYRNQYSIVPNYRAPATRVPLSIPISDRYRASSSYSIAALKDFTPFLDEFNSFPRRNGGLRISNNAQLEENANVRWASQGSEMMPSYFNGRDIFDEHRDLRLDIDDMGYEELLALEERIGNVNTGLQEGQLSLCLKKSLHYSPNSAPDPQHDVNCPICLEEYMEKDNIGIMACLHKYHTSCIKNWLRIKNVCPICKAPAMDDTALENNPH